MLQVPYVAATSSPQVWRSWQRSFQKGWSQARSRPPACRLPRRPKERDAPCSDSRRRPQRPDYGLRRTNWPKSRRGWMRQPTGETAAVSGHRQSARVLEVSEMFIGAFKIHVEHRRQTRRKVHVTGAQKSRRGLMKKHRHHSQFSVCVQVGCPAACRPAAACPKDPAPAVHKDPGNDSSSRHRFLGDGWQQYWSFVAFVCDFSCGACFTSSVFHLFNEMFTDVFGFAIQSQMK